MKHSNIWHSPYGFSEKHPCAHALAFISLVTSALQQRSQNSKTDPPALAGWQGQRIFILVIIFVIIILFPLPQPGELYQQPAVHSDPCVIHSWNCPPFHLALAMGRHRQDLESWEVGSSQGLVMCLCPLSLFPPRTYKISPEMTNQFHSKVSVFLSVFCHCEEIPEIMELKGGKIYFCSGLLGPVASGLVARRNITERSTWQRKLFTSWQPESEKERNRKH